MSKSLQRVVPWIDRAEFLEVYHSLYSDHEELQRNGVDKVALWRCRVHHKLPVAIDCTSVLVASILLCTESERSGKCQANEHQIKLSHAMALIRLVNHITEKGQTKQYAQSVHTLAAEFGLPEWLVDLRHDSTHGDLPALDLLTEGIQWALDWLHQGYWKKQLAVDDIGNGDPSGMGDDDVIQRLLVEFMQIQFDRQYQDISKRCRQSVSEMERTFPRNKKLVVDYMVDHGYLIIMPDQLKAMGISDDFVNSGENLHLPDEIILFWKPVLKLLHRIQGTALLLKTLCTQLSEEENLANRVRAGWIFEIVKSINMAEKYSELPVPKRNLYRFKCAIPFSSLIEICLGKPCVYTLPLVKLFLEADAGGMSSRKRDILELLRIYRGPSEGMSEATMSSPVVQYHTVKDLPFYRSLSKVQKNMEHDNSSDVVPWRRCEALAEWCSIPLGMLPHQDEVKLALKMNSAYKVSTSNIASPQNLTSYQARATRQEDDSEEENFGTAMVEETVVPVVPTIQLL